MLEECQPGAVAVLDPSMAVLELEGWSSRRALRTSRTASGSITDFGWLCLRRLEDEGSERGRPESDRADLVSAAALPTLTR